MSATSLSINGGESMGQVPWNQLIPDMPTNFKMPFWYSSLQSFWLFYPVDPSLAAATLPEFEAGHGVKIAEFEELDGRALASLDLQLYTSGWDQGLSVTRELEFNIYVYPEAAPAVPLMPWQRYLAGDDQTKTIGGFRIHVPCDNTVAIDAGKEFFGEPKWLATFSYTVPSLNSPGVTSWEYGIYKHQPPRDKPEPPPLDDLFFQITADLSGVHPVTSNLSPLIEFGTHPDPSVCRAVNNFWNFYGPFDTYILNENTARAVQLTLGPARDNHRMREDVEVLIGSTAPIAAQTFTSAPVSAESRAWYEVPAK
jgi:hypothetical protein